MKQNLIALVLMGWCFLSSFHAQAGILDDVRKRGHLTCGVSQGLTGFSIIDSKGEWQGIDVDFCRALAAAVLGDSRKVQYRPLSAKERFTALQSGEIDVLSRNTSWTLVRDTTLGLDFPAVVFYDGQGFLVRKSKKIKTAQELKGATVCVNSGTTTELNIADYFRSHGIPYKLVAFEKSDEVIAAYDAGRCDVFSTDVSGLYASRLKLRDPDSHVILDDVISKEPLSPAVRHGDQQWTDIVRWTVFAWLEAEELGVNQGNLATMLQSKSPPVRRLLGLDGDLGKTMGLSNDWVVQILRQVGNYAEVFDVNLGSQSQLRIDRGRNRLWKDGGLHYPMPFR